MKYYSTTVRQRVRTGGQSPGLQLARLAVKHGYSVAEIATMTGASRQTVYNWYAGHKVSNAYIQHVRKLIEHIKNKGGTMSADFMPASSMSDEELLKNAQMWLDRKEPMPLEWQQELVKRFNADHDLVVNEF